MLVLRKGHRVLWNRLNIRIPHLFLIYMLGGNGSKLDNKKVFHQGSVGHIGETKSQLARYLAVP